MTKEVQYKKDGFIGQRITYLPGIVKKKVLRDSRISDLYITHIGIFPRAEGHYRNRILGCSQYILLYCTEGKGWVEINGKQTDISSNQLFIISPGTPSRYGADPENPWTNYWIHFSGENAEQFSPSVNKVIEISPSGNSRIEDRLLLFEEMLQNVEDYFQFEKVVYANICLKHFLTSIKYLDVYRSIKIEPQNDFIKKAIFLMKNNLGRKIQVTELAERCNCSVSNLYKLFRKNLDSSPQDFFIHLKMERAQRYLTHSNLKVKEIAIKLGYDDPYYFSRIFSKHAGQSPAHFRKEEK